MVAAKSSGSTSSPGSAPTCSASSRALRLRRREAQRGYLHRDATRRGVHHEARQGLVSGAEGEQGRVVQQGRGHAADRPAITVRSAAEAASASSVTSIPICSLR